MKIFFRNLFGDNYMKPTFYTGIDIKYKRGYDEKSYIFKCNRSLSPALQFMYNFKLENHIHARYFITVKE